MAEVPYYHKSLRNANINYRSGWWSVTIQVVKNKSIFGTIVGEKVVLNALGQSVVDYWRKMPAKYPELELFDFVVMPNHFHSLLRIHFAPTSREHQLGFLMSRFKGGTSFIYGQMRHRGEVEDIGTRLWQRDYWDDLVTSESEFKGWQKYIRENPANWSSDRYGACTAYALGNVELLNRPRIAFVASQGFYASELKPRRIWARSGEAPEESVLISTFTSAQEREALRRALAKKRALIAVFPAGVPVEDELDPGLARAIQEGWALAVSPQAPGSRLNKKVATWCNEFLLKNAAEIWVGDLSANGMLRQMLIGLGRLKPPPAIQTTPGQSGPAAATQATPGTFEAFYRGKRL
ncbi:MAG: transposase [Kiritimatiellae bacterium]|nr:transposase [Kiritimatiellia bacterium]